MRTKVHPRIAAASLLLTLVACTAWEPVDVGPTPEALPSTIRVTLATGVQKRLYDPQVRVVEGDTLISGRMYQGGPAWEASLRDVQRVESGSVEGSASVLAGLGIVGGRRAMVHYLMARHCETQRCD